METETKTRSLSNLIDYQDTEKGFTLIELLVVIIIIGILAAIALPSFLSQANKAKESEAKTYIGACNTAQQTYYTEKSAFTNDLNSLGSGMKTQTSHYTYSITLTGSGTNAMAICKTAPHSSALKSYVGKVYIDLRGSTSDPTTVSTICVGMVPPCI